MANLIISVDAESLKKARISSVSGRDSVDALLRDFLGPYSGVGREQRDAANRVAALSRGSKSCRGGLKWTRDELHERT